MNRTRSHWSKDLKCCKKEVHFQPFIIASSFVLFLPVAFYIFCFLYSKRLEFFGQSSNLITNNANERNTNVSKNLNENNGLESDNIANITNDNDSEDIIYKPHRKNSKKIAVTSDAGPSNALSSSPTAKPLITF